MDRLRAMEVFVQVVEQSSFTRAARALRLPKASATTYVQSLESHLGVKLLNRTTRRLSLTLEGSLYYEEASRLLRSLAGLEDDLARAAASPTGRLRIDVPAVLGRHVLAPALPEFLQRHPGLVLEIGSGDRPVDLMSGAIDCVVRGGEVHDEALVARKLGSLPVVTCAAPSYLAQAGRPEHPGTLTEHTFVHFFSPKTGRVFEVDFSRGEQDYELTPPHRVAANDADTWIALAVAGLGLIQAPCSTVLRDHLRAGRVVRVLQDWSAESLPMAILYPRNRHLPARVRVFIEWFVDLYARECRAADRFVAESSG